VVDHPTPEELIVFETLRSPVACAEILFNDFDNLSSFSENENGDVRLYQYPFLSFDSQYLDDEKLSKKENFNNRKGMAEGYILGGRGTGKTLFALVVDCIIATFNRTYKWGIVESCDDDHVKTVMEKIVTALEFHPILRLLETYKNTQRKPYRIVSNNGCLLESVNDNLYGKDPGKHWFGKHCDRIFSEESSFITKEVTDNKLRAVSELGVVERFSGMTTFSKVSPMGEIFDNLENESKIVNTPSCVNPSWCEEEDKKAQLQFGGVNSVGYQVQILGKVIENDAAVFNMDEIRKTYIKDFPIKAFEINKNNYFRFKEILILDRPINSEKMVMALDVGEGGAPTEIIVLSQTSGVYKYIYNITVFKLSSEEHYELLEHLIELIQINLIGVDVTSGVGKAIISHLSIKYSERLIPVAFNENIDIDFEKDSNGEYVYNNGQIQFKKDRVDSWSIQCLKKLFYNGKIKCLTDLKLDTQFGGVIAKTSSQGKTLYGCKVENHQFQAWQVFAIVDFLTEFKNIKPIQKRTPVLGLFENI